MDMQRQTPAALGPMARWVLVLEAYSERGEWGIRDLAAHTGLSRSSVHRVVQEMTRLGLLTEAGAPGRARVGPTLARLSSRLVERVDVLRIAGPVLDGLREETGETAILTLYDRARRQFRAVIAAESSHPIRYIWESLQEWSDVHLGASGKGILAFLPRDEQDRILSELPDPIPGPRTTTHLELRRNLDDARARGWVVSHGDRVPGAVGVSSPIRDAAGRVIGDVLLGWPDNRTDATKERRVAEAAARAAATISAALGSPPPDQAGATRPPAQPAPPAAAIQG